MYEKIISLLKEVFSYFVAYKAGQTSAKIKQKDNTIRALKIREEIRKKLKDKDYVKNLDEYSRIK